MNRPLIFLIFLSQFGLFAQNIKPTFDYYDVGFLMIDGKLISADQINNFSLFYLDTIDHLYEIKCKYEIGKIFINKLEYLQYLNMNIKRSYVKFEYTNKKDSICIYEIPMMIKTIGCLYQISENSYYKSGYTFYIISDGYVWFNP
jgi:hypothetical protein